MEEIEDYCGSPTYVEYNRSFEGGLYKSYKYFFASRSVSVFDSGFPGGVLFTIPDGTIIDVYQNSPQQIYRRVVVGSAVLHQNVFNAFGTKRLIKVQSSGTTPDGILKVWIFNRQTKLVEYTEYPTPIPCHPGYSITSDTVLLASCEGYTRNTYYHDGNGGITIQSVPNSTLCGYVVPAENIDITVIQRVRIEHCEPINPIMLAWKNSLGGWDSWLFSAKQIFSIDTETKGFVGVPIWDIESAEETQKEVGKSKQASCKLGADNLTVQEKIGIEEVLSSNIVYQLFKDGSKRRVSVNKGSYISIDNSSTLQSIEFEIQLPDYYTLSN